MEVKLMKGREIFKIEGDKITRLRKHCPKCGSTPIIAEGKECIIKNFKVEV